MRHGKNEVRLQALHRAPPSSYSVGCEAGGSTCSERETGTEKLCDQVNQGSFHIVGAKLIKAPKGDIAFDLHIIGAKPSEAPEG